MCKTLFALVALVVIVAASNATTIKKPISVMDDMECEVCKELIVNLKRIIKNNEQHINDKGSNICDQIAEEMSWLNPYCKSTFTQIANIEELIKNNENPLVICEKLKVCK